LRSAICLQPLTAAQIDLYFEQAGDRLSALKAVLPQDAELQELAKSPLMLSVMSLAYQDFTPEQLTVGGKIEDYRKRLFATYIDRMFQRRGTTQQYSREDSQRWLIWLAQRMTVASQTMFLIERLQPSWLRTKGQRIRYRLESGCFIGGMFMLDGLSDGLMGVIAGLIFGLWVGFMGDIKPIETLSWSWKQVRNGFLYCLILGLFLSLILGLIIWLSSGFGVLSYELNNWLIDLGLLNLLYEDEPPDKLMLIDSVMRLNGLMGTLELYGLEGLLRLIMWLIMWLIFGLICGLISGFRGSEIQQREKPNQGIFRSALNAAIIGIPIVFIVGVSVGRNRGVIFGLIEGLAYGMIPGLIYGGNACMRHFVLRLTIYRKKYAPWNYTRFLDHATERLFLQKVGGGYIFVHRMLLEHFAEMSIEQEK
jgi:hypothetical protein